MRAKPTKSQISPETVNALSRLDVMWQEVESARAGLRLSYLIERPADSFTVGEFSRRFNLPRGTAVDQLGAMVRAGTLQKFRALVTDGLGRSVGHNVYVVVKSETLSAKGSQ